MLYGYSASKFCTGELVVWLTVIEKQQKSRFCLQFFLLKSSLQTHKSTFTAKFSPSPTLEVIFLLLFLAGVELQPLILVHTDLASIFNITTALHAGK